jgi:hypothetical protein
VLDAVERHGNRRLSSQRENNPKARGGHHEASKELAVAFL